MSDQPAPEGVDLPLEFVRFCYRRRPVGWPLLYDEMSAVAGHGLFRGMGYLDLAEHGISLCLPDLPRLVELTQRVIAEEAAIVVEPLAGMVSLLLAPAST